MGAFAPDSFIFAATARWPNGASLTSIASPGYGDTSYRTYTPPSPVHQGFGIAVTPKGGPTAYRTLDKHSFSQIEFSGEYPIGKVHYRGAKDSCPLDVSLEAMSPFIPLDARDSATPGTILRYRVTNTSAQPVDVAFGGWIQNPVGQRHVGRYTAVRQNRAVHESGLASLMMSVRELERPTTAETRTPEVFADFESNGYGKWKKTGTAFGEKPVHGTLPNQQPVSGFGGNGLVNSYVGGDQSTGHPYLAEVHDPPRLHSFPHRRRQSPGQDVHQPAV